MCSDFSSNYSIIVPGKLYKLDVIILEYSKVRIRGEKSSTEHTTSKTAQPQLR